MNRKRQESYVYILTNFKRNVLYVGVTSHLEKRVNEHKSKQIGHGDLWPPLDFGLQYEKNDQRNGIGDSDIDKRSRDLTKLQNRQHKNQYSTRKNR